MSAASTVVAIEATHITQIVVSIIAAAGVLAAAFVSRGKKDREVYRRKQDEIHEHVVNTHDTNLRDDVDGLRDLFTTAMKTMNATADAQRDVVIPALRQIRTDVATLTRRHDNLEDAFSAEHELQPPTEDV